MLDERKLISQLESDIEQYDQIFLVSEDRTLLREAVSVLCRLQEPVGSNRKQSRKTCWLSYRNLCQPAM